MFDNITFLSVQWWTSINEPLIRGFLKSKWLIIKSIDLQEWILKIHIESETSVILDSYDVKTFVVYQDNEEIFSYVEYSSRVINSGLEGCFEEFWIPGSTTIIQLPKTNTFIS